MNLAGTCGAETEKKQVDDAGIHAECIAETRLWTQGNRSQEQQFRAEVEVAGALRKVSYRRKTLFTAVMERVSRGRLRGTSHRNKLGSFQVIVLRGAVNHF